MPADHPQNSATRPLHVSRALEGRRVLVVGATGFLGKVVLAHLVTAFSAREIIVGLRPSPGQAATTRFARDVWQSACFGPARAQYGDRPWSRIRPVRADVTEDNVGLDADVLDEMARDGLDLVLNVAGAVQFDAPLDRALRVNSLGSRRVAELATSLGAGLVHTSTCFVAGYRRGYVAEERLPGLVDAERVVTRALAWADERREGARGRGREARAAVDGELRAEGARRAEEAGFPNVYTWSKALGEVLVGAACDRSAIVRPSVVESTAALPFPGWSEGMTTSAPLVYLGYRGHRLFPSRRGHVLDVVPADFVSSVILASGAALIDGGGAGVLQVATSDVNPLRYAKLATLSSEAFARARVPSARRARVVPELVYRHLSVPAWRRGMALASRLLATARGERLQAAHAWTLEQERGLAAVEGVLLSFHPFAAELSYRFSSSAARALMGRVVEEDAARLPFDLEGIDWDRYWRDVHVPALMRWIFPALDRALLRGERRRASRSAAPTASSP